MQKIHLLFLLTLLLFGCRKGELINKVIVEEDGPTILVVSSFKGKVVDEAGEPVVGAVVRVYHETTTTNGKGLFSFTNVEAPKGGALVSVEKSDYFMGSSMAGNSAGGKNYVQVSLMEKGIPKPISASIGGTLQWLDGSKVTIKANTLQTADGAAYTGDVNVFARWLDPSDADLGAIMPGALMALDGEGDEKVLASYGMMALELETAFGEKLKIKDGETADLELPIPPSLDPGAPTEIPLWYFDLEEERWLLKGVCTKSNGSYHCSVPSGGYWNCDIALEPICLSGTIFQTDSTPAFYTKVIVEDLTDNFIYWGYTDIEGFFCGSVPKGALLKITIQDLCGNILYQENIGPYVQDFDLGDIYLPNTLQQYFIHVSGQILDCAGAPVALGQIAVQYPGKIRLFPLSSPGVIDFSLALNCIEFPELLITGYDLTNFKASLEISISDTTEINLGIMNACTDPEDYFHLNVGTTPYSAAPTRFYKKTNVTTNWMVLEALTLGGRFTLDLRQYQGLGTYSANVFLNTSDDLPNPVYPILNSASPAISLSISADDGVFISGNFSGTAYDVFGQPQAVNGDFKIKKEL